MINGSVLAPFVHDSTWPDEVLAKFRPGVYYRHVHVPGRDCVGYLRELILYLEKDRSGMLSAEWKYMKHACHRTVHLAVKGATDEGMANYTKNLLIFANLLLIGDFGYASTSSLRYEYGDVQKNAEHEKKRAEAENRFSKSIDDAYSGLESAIESLRQRDGTLRGSMNLEDSNVLSSIPSTHHFIEHDDNPTMVINFKSGLDDVCNYEFRPHDPIGWEMTGGSPQKDRFRDDPMLSLGVWGKSA